MVALVRKIVKERHPADDAPMFGIDFLDGDIGSIDDHFCLVSQSFTLPVRHVRSGFSVYAKGLHRIRGQNGLRMVLNLGNRVFELPPRA